MGAPGIAIDAPALLSFNFRAIGEFATYYGVEIGRQEERIFALAILHYAASPKDASKGLLMAEIAKVTKQAASKKTWEKLNQSALVKIVEAIATKIGIKLTKGRSEEHTSELQSLMRISYAVFCLKKKNNKKIKKKPTIQHIQ